MYDSEMYQRTVLSPFLSFCSNDIIIQEMEDGFRHNVRGIIVESYQVPLLKEVKVKFPESKSRIGMTVGYPFGGITTEVKVELTKYALAEGLDEIDVGINVNALMSGDYETVKEDLKAVLDAAGEKMNVIPVSWLVRLSLENIDKLCQLYIELGIRTMKTSAGLHFGDMKVEHVSYVHNHYGDKLEIEVAGRCRTREKAEAMKAVGASYFHMSQWRRICGEGQDYQFDYITKQGGYGEYKDRL